MSTVAVCLFYAVYFILVEICQEKKWQERTDMGSERFFHNARLVIRKGYEGQLCIK